MIIKNRRTLDLAREHLRAQSAEEMLLLRNNYNYLTQKWSVKRLTLLFSQTFMLRWMGNGLGSIIASLIVPVNQGEKSMKGWKAVLLGALGKTATSFIQRMFRFRAAA